MKAKPERPNLIRLLAHFTGQEDAQHKKVTGRSLSPELALLREWQAERLRGTYADLLADPGFAPACRFFLSDIYAPRDFSQRDHDFERLHALLSRFLPAHMLRLLKDALALNNLSHSLDQALLQILVDRFGMADSISTQDYIKAYRICGRYPERLHQIEQLAGIIREIGEGARLPLVGVTLRLARRPAQTAGWFELYDFLERGYSAFKFMPDIETFPQTIQDREMRILEGIFAGDPDPFLV